MPTANNLLNSYKRISALKKAEAILKEKLHEIDKQFFCEQNSCLHRLVVMYGATIFGAYPFETIDSLTFCPCCGKEAINIFPSPQGKIWVIDISAFKARNPQKKLEIFLTLYEKILHRVKNNSVYSLEDIISMLKKHASYKGLPIKTYKANV